MESRGTIGWGAMLKQLLQVRCVVEGVDKSEGVLAFQAMMKYRLIINSQPIRMPKIEDRR